MSRLTTRYFRNAKLEERKLVMVTCYDATFARLVEQADIDAILIGDSLGMVIQGHEHTLPVTLDEIIYHCRAVARGCRRPHLVGDMPFGTYQASLDQALENSTRLMKEGGVQAIKIEGGRERAELINQLTTAGVPVMGHLGLTPQSVHQFGGYRIQGRSDDAADRIIQDAKALQDAGCYSLVLEGVPATLAAHVTKALSIPTVGIGAGANCDGQILVLYDLLGLDERFNPKFLKKYSNMSKEVVDALAAYRHEVRDGAFPALAHSHQ